MKKALFSSLLVALDAAVKACVIAFVPRFSGWEYPFGGIGIFDAGFLSCSLNTIYNTGMAWGAFGEYTSALFALRILIVGGLLWYLLRPSSRTSAPFALWLIAAGAIGNILDMCLYGRVVDFIHVRISGWTFPLFNLADSCITAGAAWMLFFSRKTPVPKQL